jgi:hypothetical protein
MTIRKPGFSGLGGLGNDSRDIEIIPPRLHVEQYRPVHQWVDRRQTSVSFFNKRFGISSAVIRELPSRHHLQD